MRYDNQSDAKASAQSAANRLGVAMFVAKMARGYEVSHSETERSIKIAPAAKQE